jgi:hypothetical protein
MVRGRHEKERFMNFMLYSIAAMALTLVGYLAFDFYNEQLKTRLTPVRAAKKDSSRRRRRHQAL